RRFLPPDAASVRDHLLTASDPLSLLFVDLPAVLGIDGLQGDNIRAFVERLSQALHTMSTAYERLLDEVEAGIHTALGLSESEHGRSQLARRAAVLVPFVAEPRLQLFAREAAKSDS